MTRAVAFRFLIALTLALPACSGGEGGPTEPDDPFPGPAPAPAPPPGPAPAPPPAVPLPPADPTPVPPEQPAPPTPTNNIAGVYTLRLVNDAAPGQTVTLANPDGSVIGLYRFGAGTSLTLTEQQAWSLAVQYEDNGTPLILEDEGKFRRYGEDGRELVFESAIYGDMFGGGAVQGVAVIKYDFDGDGQAETVFGFERVAGPGD